jgi:hypothetical protein
MASKFFNKPQLGQAQLSNSQQSNLPTNDRSAEIKAQQAARNIEQLSGLGQKVVSQVTGKYLENMDAKNRLASGKQRPEFLAYVDSQIAQTENFESLGSEGLQQKYREFSQGFMDQHKDKPYSGQLEKDLDQMGERMLGNMMQKRDTMHTQIVSDSAAEGASNAAQMYSEGLIDVEQMQGRLAQLSYDSTLAFQVPSSSELDLNDDSRGKYQGLTRTQSNEAILKGIMIQTGKPNNSRVAELIDNPTFRKELGISPTDEDYNKLVKVAYQKGARADKVNYEQGLDSFKESLYTKTNQGYEVDIDRELQRFTDSGQGITAQDEHSLRKKFKEENKTNLTAINYREGLKGGKDLSAGLTKKDREAVFERSFTDVLGINDMGISIESVSSSLSEKEGQVGFSEYIKSGGKVPDKFVQMFDVPAGSSAEKWSRASAAIVSMQAAATGSGQSVEEIIGVNSVAKIRGMSRIYNDPDMEGAVKQNAIDALQTQSTSFNSKGYLKGTSEQPIDNEWLSSVSKDAPWTTDDYVSDQQNAAEIAGNYHAYRMAGNSEEDAQELANDLFNKSNKSFEMSNGGEIIIPVKHKNLNNISIEEFSKSLDSNGSPRFPSLQEQRQDLEVSTGQGWISEWRARTNISFQKSYNYGKTGKYDMLYNGKLVDQSSFSYDELENFISQSPSKLREKMTGGKHRSIQEVEESALGKRKQNIKGKQNQAKIDLRIQSLFDLGI